MSHKHLPNKLHDFGPLDRMWVLRPDNFTPQSRTPWGGTRIMERYKRDVVGGGSRVVGESWEVSVEPDFPSTLKNGQPLSALLAADPALMLGGHAAHGGLGLLVKLLDAAAPLSVQIHPRDDDPFLGENESGKPECWYIADREPDAGLYIGLKPDVSRQDIQSAVEEERDLSALLNFVPCEPGDFFVLPPGTAHAVGPGLTLVEPQRVLPGKRGLTYRYWDWNRRYNEQGVEDRSGSPRELHLERALAVTNWEAPRGDACIEALRFRSGEPDCKNTASLTPLCGPRSSLAFDALTVSRVSGKGTLCLPDMPRLRGITVLEGQLGCGNVTVSAGTSAILPACLMEVTLELDHAHAILSHLT